MLTAQWFIGYGRLEDLVALCSDPLQPFLVELVVRRIHGAFLDRAEVSLMIQHLGSNGRLHYCRIPCGSYQLLSNGAYDEELSKRVTDAANLQRVAVLRYLSSLGFVYERATVALPQGLVFLNGSVGSALLPFKTEEGELGETSI
jgi:hypothetical protein